jgi:hypothetical protein
MTKRKPQQSSPPVAVLLVLGAVALYFLLAQPAPPPPDIPPPDRPDGPDLYAVFSATGGGQQAHRDAVSFGVLCESLASIIEYDGQRGEESRLLSGVQLDDMRRWSREYYMRGESFGQRYPQLPEVVGSFLELKIGESSGGPVDDAVRGRWIAAHRSLARSALYAANRLAGQ